MSEKYVNLYKGKLVTDTKIIPENNNKKVFVSSILLRELDNVSTISVTIDGEVVCPPVTMEYGDITTLKLNLLVDSAESLSININNKYDTKFVTNVSETFKTKFSDIYKDLDIIFVREGVIVIKTTYEKENKKRYEYILFDYNFQLLKKCKDFKVKYDLSNTVLFFEMDGELYHVNDGSISGFTEFGKVKIIHNDKIVTENNKFVKIFSTTEKRVLKTYYNARIIEYNTENNVLFIDGINSKCTAIKLSDLTEKDIYSQDFKGTAYIKKLSDEERYACIKYDNLTKLKIKILDSRTMNIEEIIPSLANETSSYINYYVYKNIMMIRYNGYSFQFVNLDTKEVSEKYNTSSKYINFLWIGTKGIIISFYSSNKLGIYSDFSEIWNKIKSNQLDPNINGVYSIDHRNTATLTNGDVFTIRKSNTQLQYIKISDFLERNVIDVTEVTITSNNNKLFFFDGKYAFGYGEANNFYPRSATFGRLKDNKINCASAISRNNQVTVNPSNTLFEWYGTITTRENTTESNVDYTLYVYNATSPVYTSDIIYESGNMNYNNEELPTITETNIYVAPLKDKILSIVFENNSPDTYKVVLDRTGLNQIKIPQPQIAINAIKLSDRDLIPHGAGLSNEELNEFLNTHNVSDNSTVTNDNEKVYVRVMGVEITDE